MLFSNQVPPPNLMSLVGRITPRPAFFVYDQYDQANVRELGPGRLTHRRHRCHARASPDDA